MKKFRSTPLIVISILLAATILAACQMKPTPPPTIDPLDSIRTAAARTVEALTTQIVATEQAAQTQTAAYQAPTELPQPSETEQVLTPENPSDPTTPNPEQSATPTGSKACDLAGFVEESIPDGTQFTPGSSFTKTWKLTNEGTCTWTTDYDVVFVGGTSMNTPASQPISDKAVAPGESVLISMPVTAPNSAGTYRAEFKLRNAEEVIFAFRNPEHTFWVEIQVRGDQLNLADSYCSAEWTNGTDKLHCPGQPEDSGGFVYSDNTPLLENGAKDDETALWLGLPGSNDSYLKGTYPAMLIPNNAKFTTILGCKKGNLGCDVEFSLTYQDGSGALQEVESWREMHNGEFQKINVDLSSLGGRQVKIVLIVRSLGSSSGDVIHLLKPMIQP